MRVRIVKHLPRTLEGISLERFERDGIYDVSGSVLDLLMVSGYAEEVSERRAASREEAIKGLASAQIPPGSLPIAALQHVPRDDQRRPVRSAPRRRRKT